MNTKLCLLSALLASTPLSLAAQSLKHARSLPLLELSTDARSAALGGNHYGEQYSALLYTNPTSLLYSTHKAQLSASGNALGSREGMQGALGLYTLSAGFQLSPQHGLLVGLRYLGGLRFEGIDLEEQATGSLSWQDYSLDLGYTLRLKRLSAYVTASYVQSQLGDRKASTAVFGLGAFYRSAAIDPSQGLSYTVGVKGQHLGLGFKYSTQEQRLTYPPMSVGAGGELRYALSSEHRLGLGAAVDVYTYPMNSSSVVLSTGAEYRFRKFLAARFGYHYDSQGTQGITAGLGLQFSRVQLDAAYQAAQFSQGKPAYLLTLGLSL